MTRAKEASYHIVSVRKKVGFDDDRIAEHAFHGESAAVEFRFNMLNGDSQASFARRGLR
jgi:hypothetical protein